jgi:hypothetical protein
MNYLEEITFNSLVEENGQTWESMEESLVTLKLTQSKKLFDIASNMFKCTPTAHNYNLLVISMMTLQYWNQKRINKVFTVEAEF